METSSNKIQFSDMRDQVDKITDELKASNSDKIKEIQYVTWVGFWGNVVLSVFKIVGGFLGNSRAVVADGVHSISDIITNIVVLIGVKYWMMPPDKGHPYGHKRLESLVSLFIGVVLGFAGIGIAYDAACNMFSGVSQPTPKGPLAISAALFSIILKEILYRWTLKKAKELDSEALEASAREHRADVYATLPVLAAVGIALFFPTLAAVDLIGAFVVAFFIEHSAYAICKPAVDTLLDKGASEAIQQKIIQFILTYPGTFEVHNLRTRYMGKAIFIDMHVRVANSLTIEEGDKIAHGIEHLLRSDEARAFIGVQIEDALVHIDPLQDHRKEWGDMTTPVTPSPVKTH